MKLRIGSLFSGIGGLELGLERALRPVGAHTVWQCEQDPYCNTVLAKHWPNTPRWQDVRTFNPKRGSADLICGGFPCQDLSVVGRGAGLEGAKSGLWRDFSRIVARVEPAAVVVENAGRGWRRWVPHVRGDLAALGYHSIHMRVRAVEVGAPHERSRVFVIAANPDRLHLWQQSRRGRRTKGEEAAQPICNGAKRTATNWPERSPEPVLCGVDDGVPAGMDRERLKALGNAVVPQVAEVVGAELLEVMR